MDLHQIADHMFEREENLSVHLGLTPADISNVKERNPFKPELHSLCHDWKYTNSVHCKSGN